MLKNSSFFSCLLLCFVLSCGSEEPSTKIVETMELKDFETLVSLESNSVGLPIILKVKDQQSFFVYDIGDNQILEMDWQGAEVNKIGRTGRGPGEYLFVNNIFLTDESLYIIDSPQLLAHQYDRGGDLVSTFNFGEIAGSPIIPPPSFGGGVRANEIDNQPFITLQGDIILSNVNVGAESQSIFQLIDWGEGNQLSEIGDVPEGSSFVLDNAKLRNEAVQGEIPSFYKANSFPVQDRANPDEFFIIYSSLPRIAKYTSTGEKLWVNDSINSRETEAIRNRFFEAMDRMSESSDIRSRADLEFYISGASSDAGDLYLVVNTKPVVIHQFNRAGELIHKYAFTSEDVTPVLDFDFLNNRILATTEDGEIRIYHF